MLEIAMAHTKPGVIRHNEKHGNVSAVVSRRSYSAHAKLINNAFLIVFAQYERAFEELAKV